MFKLGTGYIDSHCHLSDQRFASQIQEVINRSSKKNITQFLLAGVGPEDWDRQEKLIGQFPDIFFPCYGLHPYWVSENNLQACQRALEQLDKKLFYSIGLGETGLDFRSTIVKDNQSHQIHFFKEQVQLAKNHEKALVLHVVRAHAEVIKELKSQKNLRSGIIHSFSSKASFAKEYTDLGFYLSVGCSVLHHNNHSLHQALKKIPISQLLVETDSPDQPPPDAKGLNEPTNLILVAEKIAELKGLKTEDVLINNTANLKKVFYEELR